MLIPIAIVLSTQIHFSIVTIWSKVFNSFYP